MKYKIIVDKQDRTNPSSEKREYEIETEELYFRGNIYDSIVITKNEDYIMRRLQKNEYNVLNVLEEPVKEVLPDLNVELFEGENYIYLLDIEGNKLCAEYLVKNEFTDTYVMRSEMNSAINQTADQIELTVNQKLIDYATEEELEDAKTELNSAITQKADEISSTVSKQYVTKAESETNISNAKDEAIDSANANTESKLENYSTTVQMNSAITQKANEISSTVSTKVGEDEIISKINQSAEAIQINADKIDIDGKTIHFKTQINYTVGPFTEVDLNKMNEYLRGERNLTTQEFNKYDINGDGEINSLELFYVKKAILNGGYLTFSGTYEIDPNSANKSIALFNSNGRKEAIISLMDNYFRSLTTGTIQSKSINNEEKISTNELSTNSLLINDGTMDIRRNDTDIEMVIASQMPVVFKTSDNVRLFEISRDGVRVGAGRVMFGRSRGHTYTCEWTGSQLQFWVDSTNVGVLSDRRLKTDIKDIDEDFVKIIEELEMKQFKVANRNGLISFGIIAQDLMDIFEKYDKNPFDYEIVQETLYQEGDDTKYYTINYEQFLILKTKAQEQAIKKLKEKDEEKEKLIKSLLERVERLEVANGKD